MCVVLYFVYLFNIYFIYYFLCLVCVVVCIISPIAHTGCFNGILYIPSMWWHRSLIYSDSHMAYVAPSDPPGLILKQRCELHHLAVARKSKLLGGVQT